MFVVEVVIVVADPGNRISSSSRSSSSRSIFLGVSQVCRVCLSCGGLTVIVQDYLRSNYQGRGAILRSFFIHV